MVFFTPIITDATAKIALLHRLKDATWLKPFVEVNHCNEKEPRFRRLKPAGLRPPL
jgi:hypothetical protein